MTPPNPKLCLRCALRKLAKQPEKPCGDCVLLNVDPLAKARANAAKPGPLMIAPSYSVDGCTLFTTGVPTKPARGSFGGGGVF